MKLNQRCQWILYYFGKFTSFNQYDVIKVTEVAAVIISVVTIVTLMLLLLQILLLLSQRLESIWKEKANKRYKIVGKDTPILRDNKN